jgi:lipid-binding SYLF domain-containing protein
LVIHMARLAAGRRSDYRQSDPYKTNAENAVMQSRLSFVAVPVTAFLLLAAGAAHGQRTAPPPASREAEVVDSSIQVLGEVMAIPAKSIPAGLLQKAEGVVIIPGMIKGGFIVGVRRGRGVVVTRDEAGKWKPPMFVTITGASVGWQAGVQGTDLVLVFRTKNSLQNLMTGKFTIGANASAAAGPVGRDAQAATDAALKAEILSYSRSRGLFAGVALDGAVLSVDQAATNAYYYPTGNFSQPGPIPVSAARLQDQIAKYSATPAPVNVSAVGPAAVTVAPAAPAATALPPAAHANPQVIRAQLITSSRQLSAVLDPSWRAYLALPAEVYSGDRWPSPESLKVSLDHFAMAGSDPRFQTLAQHPEFRSTWSLLRQYSAVAPQPASQPLMLPPPPR